MKSVMIALGTRPEAIKLAPVFQAMKARQDRIRLICCITGQHRHILDPILEVFDIRPDYDLNLIRENQTLFHITTGVLDGVREVLEKERPDIVLVQGDTTSAFAVALGAFYLKVPVGHVEAGLRSYDRFQPYPEEVNR
ncbi:MAG: UDP-N-acetylglucosamine 2-epimerase, partial [Pseudomonadota bacterium]